MPYTPNNPLVPGDPYSYDLKWIVTKLKEIESYTVGIDDKITAAVAAAYAEHGEPVIYNTVADMLAADQPSGSLAFTKGYYAPEDMGSNIFYISDIFDPAAYYYITFPGGNKYAYPIILSEYVTPQMFGAYGDGIEDDYTAISTALLYDKELLLPSGSYLISSPLTVNDTWKKITGFGSGITTILYNGSGYALTCENTSIAWRNCQYVISGLTIRSSVAGCINFINATQSKIMDCRCYSPSQTDVDNILISNESHYAIITNCYINGGNGIHIDSSCNGCNISNNYLAYNNISMNIEGGQHLIKQNDIEGYSSKPVIIACVDSDIDANGERNLTGNIWVDVTGSYNRINIRMLSDGASYYNPLLRISGNMNRITITHSKGYAIINSDTGIGNVIDIIRAEALTNYNLINSANIPLDTFITENNVPLLFEDGDLTSYIQNASGFTYDPATQEVYITTAGTYFTLDFTSLVGSDPYYVYYEFAGISAPGHGNMAFYNNGSSGASSSMHGKVSAIVYPGTVFFANIGGAGAKWKISKLRIAKYFTPKLYE